jgi:hypothetical protein
MRGKKMSVEERVVKMESDKRERRKIFKELCDHLRRGYSMDCFGPLSDTSIRSYINLYPEEFNKRELEEALREAKQSWEDIGRKQSNGSCMGNSRSWYYNMANRYGWRERLEVEAEHKGSIAVQVVSYATNKGCSDTEKG